MKIFDSRKSIVLASIGVLFASLALVSCEKREEPLLNEMAKYSKTIVFTEQQQQTRASYIDYTTAMPSAEYVLRSEEAADSLFLSEYVTDLATEEYMTRATETTTTNLGQFRILAYNVGANGTLSINQNLSKLVGKKSDGTWSYGAVKDQDDINWSELGSDNVKFFAYANLSTGMATLVENSSTQFQLTLPTNAADQADIIVAEAENSYNSSTTEQVPLNFNHICAGVKFVVGSKSEISGYVKSIKLKNIVGKANYDISKKEWTGRSLENAVDFIVGDNFGHIPEGEQIGTTLMLIPQPLDESATIEIEFVVETKDNNGNVTSTTTRTLSRKLEGEFQAGKMYTYKISNHKVELLNFIEVPSYKDAHYEMFPIKLKISEEHNGTATLKATASDGATVEMRLGGFDKLSSYEQQGYWIDNASYSRTNGNEDLKRITTGSISNIAKGETTIYLFLPENATTTNRTITLELTSTDKNASNKEAKITQFCPEPTTGCERIEENPFVPWGPYWTFSENSTKVVFAVPDRGDNDAADWLRFYALVDDAIEALSFIFGNSDGIDPEGVEYTYNWGNVTVEIDYSAYLNFSAVTSTTTGLQNTRNLFAGEGGVDLAGLQEIEDNLAAANATQTSQNKVTRHDPVDSAIKLAVRKNKYKLTKESQGEDEVILLTIPSTDILWYLPAEKEIKNDLKVAGVEGETSISGMYWTSTTTQGSSSNSRVYNSDAGTFTSDIRTAVYKCRAVRDGYPK